MIKKQSKKTELKEFFKIVRRRGVFPKYRYSENAVSHTKKLKEQSNKINGKT